MKGSSNGLVRYKEFVIRLNETVTDSGLNRMKNEYTLPGKIAINETNIIIPRVIPQCFNLVAVLPLSECTCVCRWIILATTAV